MTGEPTAEIRTIQAGERKIGYAREFRKMLREHPGIVRTAMNLTQKAEAEYNPPDVLFGVILTRWNKEKKLWEDIAFDGVDRQEPQQINYGRGTILKAGEPQVDPSTGLEITLLGISSRDFRDLGWRLIRTDRTSYLKMQLGDQTFFVKSSTATNNPGFDEFTNTVKLKQALQNVDDISVIEAQLGYSDKQRSWFVSKWEDLENAGFVTTGPGSLSLTPVNDYGNILPSEIRHEYEDNQEYKKVEEVKQQIKDNAMKIGLKLHDIDVNLFYNPETKKYLILDVTGAEEANMINQPS